MPKSSGRAAELIHAPEAEAAVLGALLQGSEAFAYVDPAGLVPADFHGEAHAEIFRVITERRGRGASIDPVGVFLELQARGAAERCGGLPYLNQLFEGVALAKSAAEPARAVKDHAQRRSIQALGQAIQRVAAVGAEDARRAQLALCLAELNGIAAPRRVAPLIPLEWAHLMPDELQAPPQLVEGVLTAGGMSEFYGESNSGKSYLAIHLAICVSLGLPWLGKRTQRHAVIYVAAEGAWSIRLRLAAYRKHYGHRPGKFGLIAAPLSLVDPSTDVEHLIDLVTSTATDLGEPVGLIVVDTVARVLGGGDENAAQDMGRLVSAGDRIREATGAHLLYIHHAGKDTSRGARGHSSLRAALDTEVEVTADEATKTHTAKITKQRDLPSKGERIAARFVPVELGVDQWGGAVTACAVITAEPETASKGPARLTGAMQAVLAYMAGRDAGAKRAVVVDALTQQGMSRPTVYRAINDLLACGLLVTVAGLLYVPKD